MAKGRSSKAKSAESSKEETMKVSTVKTTGGKENGEWSIVRMTADDDATTLCKNDSCQQVAVATWATKTKPNEEWPLCETCQEKEHGGWPEGADRNHDSATITVKSEVLVASTKEATETPGNIKEAEEDTTMMDDNKEITSNNTDVMMEDADSQQDNTNAAPESKDVVMEESESTQDKDSSKEKDLNTSDPDDADEGEDEEEEQWELKKIISHDSILKTSAVCHSEDCSLLACCIYVSSTSGEKWYSCIDCQQNDFGGWPPMEELPVTSLDKNHIQLLVGKCSKKKRPAMPAFEEESLSPSRDTTQGNETNTITPLSRGTFAQASKESKVTPTPAKDTKKQAKNNATMLKKHQEWQEAANKAGGGRIVVKKSEAKPIIFQALYDSMKPMNITQIYTELKATVPSSVLKLCLDDMALDNKENQFYDSDEDEAPKKTVKSEPLDESLAGSLSFKGGRNPNSSLYYVDHSKQKNNGNGLEPHVRNELASDLAKVQEENSMLKSQHQNMTKDTEKLLSEPTNEEATATLEREEAEWTEIQSKLEELRAMKCNENVKKQLKKRIENMTQQWRKRKGICMNFLLEMESASEGTISAKKCCTGDGQIDIESDESVVKNAIAYGKKKRSMASQPSASRKKMKVSKGLPGKTTGLASEAGTSGLTADENFVAVRLTSSGQVERVYISDDE